MFRHVVMFRWKPSVAPSHVDAVRHALDALSQSIPGIRDYQHGADAGLNPDNFDYVVMATFDHADAYIAYRDHPAHQSFIDQCIKEHITQRVAVQFSN